MIHQSLSCAAIVSFRCSASGTLATKVMSNASDDYHDMIAPSLPKSPLISCICLWNGSVLFEYFDRISPAHGLVILRGRIVWCMEYWMGVQEDGWYVQGRRYHKVLHCMK